MRLVKAYLGKARQRERHEFENSHFARQKPGTTRNRTPRPTNKAPGDQVETFIVYSQRVVKVTRQS